MAPGVVIVSRILLVGVVVVWAALGVLLGALLVVRSWGARRMERRLVREVTWNLAHLASADCERCRQRRQIGGDSW